MSSFDSQGRFTAPVSVVDPSTMINNFTADGRFVQPVMLIDPTTGSSYAPGLSPDMTIGSSDWANPGTPVFTAPAVGGRVGQHLRRPIGMRTLAYFGTKADCFSAPASIADVADPDAFVGTTQTTITTVATTINRVFPAAFLSSGVDVTGGMIVLWMKPLLNIFANCDRFSLEIHSAGSPASPSANFHTTDIGNGPSDLKGRLTSQNSAGRWQPVAIPVAQFTASGAGADITNIIGAAVNFRSSAGNSLKVAIAKIDFIPNGLTKAKFIFGFDDANVGQMTFAAPIMAKYGFRGMSYLSSIPADVGANNALWLNAAQIRSLHDNFGWQIPSQAWSTEAQATLDGMTDNQRTAEMAKLRNWHNSQGLTGGEHGSYFSGVTLTDMTSYPMFRQHFRSMRSFGTGNGAGPPFLYGEMYPWGDYMAIRALSGETYADTATPTALQAHIDQAISNKGVSFMVWHHPEQFPLSFNAVCAYLDAHRSTIDVCTEEDLHFGLT